MNKKILALSVIILACLLGISSYFYLNYSRLHADRIALIDLLHDREYDELNKILHAKQRAYVSGRVTDLVPSVGYEAFANADPVHEDLLNNWVNVHPDMYIPYLVRGLYYSDLGYAWRGTESARETSSEQFEKMRLYHNKAYSDLTKALTFNKRLPAAYGAMIGLSSLVLGDKSRESILEEGLMNNPDSYVIRKAYLFKLMPRWGGSYEEIEGFIEKISKAKNKYPHLEPLMGFKDYVVGYNLQSSGEYRKAIEHYTEALSYGEKDWILQQRGTAHWQLKEFDKAITDLSRSLELSPHFQDALTWRGIVYKDMGQIDKAMSDFNHASQIRPYDYVTHKNRGILYGKKGDFEAAVSDFKTSLYYEKHHGDTWHSLGWYLNHKLKKYAEAVKAHKMAVKLRPNEPSYWYEYAIALFNKIDCEVIPALRSYLASCEFSKDRKCRAKNQEWANETIEFLISEGKCPDK